MLDNVKTIRSESKSDQLEVKKLSKYYTVDIISKVLFAIDVDSYKERDTTFVKSAMSIGGANPNQTALITILPKKISKILGLTVVRLGPIDALGDYFKKTLKQRRKSGIKYNDLSELLQDACDENKVKMTENEVIGNILLALFGKF